MDGYDDAQRLRNQQSAADAAASQDRGVVTRGAPCQVVRVATSPSGGTSASAFYPCNIATVAGDEVEGGAGTLTYGTDVIYVLNLGTAAPPTTQPVLATFTNYRWVMRYDG